MKLLHLGRVSPLHMMLQLFCGAWDLKSSENALLDWIMRAIMRYKDYMNTISESSSDTASTCSNYYSPRNWQHAVATGILLSVILCS